MDHEGGIAAEGDEIVHDRREDGFVRQKRVGQTVDAERALRDRPSRVDVTVEGHPRLDVVDELDAADLDQPVPVLGIRTGGFGVEDDLTEHGAVHSRRNEAVGQAWPAPTSRSMRAST